MPYPNNNALNTAIDAVNSGSVTAVYSFNEASGTTMEADVGVDGTYSGTHDYEEYGGIVCDSTDTSIKLTDGAALAQPTGFRLPATGAMSLYWRIMWTGEGTSRTIWQQGTGSGLLDCYHDSAGRVQIRHDVGAGTVSTTAAGSLDNSVGPSFRDFFLTRTSAGRFALFWEGSSVEIAGASGADALSIDDADFNLYDNTTGVIWWTKLAFWDGYQLSDADIDSIHDAATNVTGGPGSGVAECRSHTCFFIGGPVDGTKWVNVADRLPLGADSLYHDMDLTGSPTVVGTADIQGWTNDGATDVAKHPDDGDITDSADELVTIDNNGPITILMRVSFTSLGAWEHLCSINDNVEAQTNDLSISKHSGDTFRARQGSTTIINSSTTLGLGPHNLAFAWDASGSEMWIDGASVGTGSSPAFTPAGYLAAGYRIGAGTNQLDGTMHFFAVFGEVLTLDEQNDIFAAVSKGGWPVDRLFSTGRRHPRPRRIRTTPKPRGRLMRKPRNT